MPLTTIRRYRDLSEAIVARSLLQSSGIDAHLCDENLIRLDWQISNFIGGLRLQVETVDETDAIALLDAPIPDIIDYDENAIPFVQPRCPLCHSTDITFEGSSRKAALTSLYLFALPLPLGTTTWLCEHCAHRWSEQEETGS
jgi:hypothetical protein